MRPPGDGPPQAHQPWDGTSNTYFTTTANHHEDGVCQVSTCGEVPREQWWHADIGSLVVDDDLLVGS